MWLYTKFIDLAWWQMLLWVGYTIYFLIKSHDFWVETDRYGLWKGYKNVIFDNERIFKVYHIILILFTIPPAVIGLLFPLLKAILRFKIYEFKPDKPKQYQYLVSNKIGEEEYILDSNLMAISASEARRIITEKHNIDPANISIYILR
jgi:hypothetical protein